MTVQELIDELMKIEDKTLFVCFQDRPNTIKTGVVSLLDICGDPTVCGFGAEHLEGTAILD